CASVCLRSCAPSYGAAFGACAGKIGRRWKRVGRRDGATAWWGHAPVPAPIGRLAMAYARRSGQRLGTIFFYVLLLVAFGLPFALDAFAGALELLFQLLKADFNILERFAL